MSARAEVVALAERADRARHELRSLRCSDPAAASAIGAIRLAAYTLENFWLPTATALAGDTPPI